MKVSVLSPDLSHNCLGRAYLLAQLLENNYEVEIIGPRFGDSIWEPVKDESDYKHIGISRIALDFPLKYPSLSEMITGDVIYASKPWVTSYGVALLHSLSADKPIILDIDDWESGFRYNDEESPLVSHLKAIPYMVDITSLNYVRAMEKLSSRADAITVSSTFLRNKFGGSLVPHVRDTDTFDPNRFNKKSVRTRFDLPKDDHIVLFSGTPREHKGLDDLVAAINSIDRSDVRLLIVGADDSDYVRTLKSAADDHIIFRGRQPFSEIPEWIASADSVAIPQKNASSTRGQLPAKVFDAMAMGKPIIATSVSDLPQILDDCGIIIDPGSQDQLAESIINLVDDSQTRDELGTKARTRCVEKYSYQAVAPKVSELVRSVAEQT